MAKQSKSNGASNITTNKKSRKGAENIGKGKVTPVQIAFIVDRYLCDNNYTQTRSTFRSEASTLISRSPVQEAPKSLLSLGAILEEYISLKEQKVLLDQERCRLEIEKTRVHNLLRGMQDVMNAFNATAHDLARPPPLPLIQSGIKLPIGSPPGCFSAYSSPAVMSTSKASNSRADPISIPSPVTNHTDLKRKSYTDVLDAPLTAKRPCRSLTSKQLLLKDASTCSQRSRGDNSQEISQKHTACGPFPCANASSESLIVGSNVVKCLFTQPTQSPPANSSGPKTPPLASSSQTENSASPLENCSTVTSSKEPTQEITSTSCTIISSETIHVSPAKQISYYSIAKNQHISTFSPLKSNLKRPNKRDHVKGRLNFDAPDSQTTVEKLGSDVIITSEAVKEVDILDLDLRNLEALGDINLSELLVDFDLDDEGISNSCQPALASSPDSTSWSPGISGNDDIGANPFISQLSSTLTEIISEKDINSSGPDSVTTVRSVTKCIKILSPVKSQRSYLDQENLPAKN